MTDTSRHDLAWSIDMVVTLRVRDTRKRFGFSQEQLAERLGVSTDEVIELETGKTALTFGRLYTIAKTFDVPITWFFDEVDS